MATSKNYGKKKVRITSGIFWTLMGKNRIMEKSDAGAACLSWTFFFPIILSVTISPLWYQWYRRDHRMNHPLWYHWMVGWLGWHPFSPFISLLNILNATIASGNQTGQWKYMKDNEGFNGTIIEIIHTYVYIYIYIRIDFGMNGIEWQTAQGFP